MGPARGEAGQDGASRLRRCVDGPGDGQDCGVGQGNRSFLPGTYELIGPKVNGNPEHSEGHRLIAHATAPTMPVPDLSFDGIRETALRWGADGVEGIVWHHEDGERFVKIKARDFRQTTPT